MLLDTKQTIGEEIVLFALVHNKENPLLSDILDLSMKEVR